MKFFSVRFFAFIFTLLLVLSAPLSAQQSPDTILYNAKLVTMNDHGVNENVGTVAQAIVIRGDAIQAVGSNNEIRALAGPSTKSFDLKGRLITPGFIATHDHPQDWDPLNPYLVKKVVSDSDHIERFLWEEPAEQKLQMFPKLLEEAVQTAKPGQWVRISLLNGRDYRGQDTITGAFGRRISKQMLDMAAPNNPVIIRAGFTGLMLNQKAIDDTKKFYAREWDQFIEPPLGQREIQTGVGAVSYRYVEQEVMYSQQKLTELYQLGLSWWAGYGLAVNASNIYTGAALTAYSTIDKNGKMAIRLPWTWYWPQRKDFFLDPYFRAAAINMQDKGSDYFWMTGSNPVGNSNECTTLQANTPEAQARMPACHYSPDTEDGKLSRVGLYEFIRGGGRFAGSHTIGDKDIDHIMDIIEQASKDAGMSVEQIRDKRHAWDHMEMNPRPDQIPRIKNLGFMLGGYDMVIYEGRAQRRIENFPEEAAQFVLPRKSLMDAGVRTSVEIDRPLGYTDLTYFTVLHTGVTRKDQDGRILNLKEAISRQAMLKAATLSGAFYIERENSQGSLEAGKLADLIILDRDYLTIPVDDIPNVRVLMNMVGGKIVHLVPSLAREFGVSPTGAQVELGGRPAQW